MEIEMEMDTGTVTRVRITINKVTNRDSHLHYSNNRMDTAETRIKDSRTTSLEEEEEEGITSHMEEITIGNLPVDTAVGRHPHLRISQDFSHPPTIISSNPSILNSSKDNKATVSTITITHGTIIAVEAGVTNLNLIRAMAVVNGNHNQV